jgi:hypothetical protein
MKPLFSVDTNIDIAGINAENNAAVLVVVGTTKSDADISKANVFWTIWILALFCGRIQATTIVVVRTPAEVAMAADSCGTMGYQPTCKSVCKISHIDDIYVAVAGLDNDANTGFSVSKSVALAIHGRHTFIEKMNLATKAIQLPLRKEAIALKKIGFLDPLLKDGVVILLIGSQEGVPMYAGQSFTVTDSRGTIKVVPSKREECPGTDCPNGLWISPVGETDAITVYRSNPMNRVVHDAAEYARTLVQVQIDKPTKGVSGPVHVVRISAANGAEVVDPNTRLSDGDQFECAGKGETTEDYKETLGAQMTFPPAVLSCG